MNFPISAMNPYEMYLPVTGCSSIGELYSKLETYAVVEMGFDQLPFPLSALERPDPSIAGDVLSILSQYAASLNGSFDYGAHLKQLAESLKANPPEMSFENPKLIEGQLTYDDYNLINLIFQDGLELPGSKCNLYGNLEYFSSFFKDMYFGNYTDFMVHVHSLSAEDLKKELTRREGYCQFSPIFAPILGSKLAKLDNYFSKLTSTEKRKVKIMYSGSNEDRQMEIFEKLLELGVDPSANDINGFTPLHYAITMTSWYFTNSLLKYHAAPNKKSRTGTTPLALCILPRTPILMEIIGILINSGANIENKRDANVLRHEVQTFGSKDLAIRVREALPRGLNECEECVKPAEKKCSACSLVFYCSPACQKLDWKFHKITCKKNKKL